MLTPGRFVGTEEVENNDEEFAIKMEELIGKLDKQMKKREELEGLIKQKLKGIGYEF